jgi:hypothetical protein
VNVRIAAALIRPTVHQIPWATALGPVALGPVLMLLFRPDEYGSPAEFVIGVRVSAVLLAVGAAFLWDEPARAITDAMPVRVRSRRAARFALYLPAAAATWALLLFAARAIGSTSELVRASDAGARISIPNLALSLEVAGMVAAAVALAAIAGRRARGVDAGLVASPLVLALATVVVLLPSRMAMIVLDPADERWAMVNRRWWWVLAGGAIAAILASRDPASRRLLRR